MNLEQKIKVKKVLVIILIWVFIGLWITVYDHVALASLVPDYVNSGTFGINLLFNCLAGFVGALLGGSFLIFYVDDKFNDKSYGYTIAAVLVSFIIIVSFITFLLGLIFVPIETGLRLISPEGWAAYVEFLTDPVHMKNIIIWSVVVSFTQLFIQINNKFGPGILLSFIKGKYRSPKYEDRIFMFVDLKGSTTIAENLGNEQYHQLLRIFFRDLTKPIIYHHGHIYQYVGDEVVISWQLDEGLQDANCLECYFDMTQRVKENGANYLDKFGLVPEFKAGVHFGRVVAGEIGVVKRDITYSGDVLNTTARIQSKCNDYQTKLLISGDLLHLLDAGKKYNIKSLGEILLRGKNKSVELCTII